MPQLKCACGRQLNYRPEQAGQKVRCPACKGVLALPEGEVVVVPIEDEESPPAAHRKPKRDDARRRHRRGDDEDDDRPVRRPRRPPAEGVLPETGRGLWTQVGAVTILLPTIIGLMLSMVGSNEMRLCKRSRSEPKSLTLAQLIQTEEKGLDNLHVVVNQFVPDLPNLVFEVNATPKERKDPVVLASKPWRTVYLPLRSVEPGGPLAKGPPPPGVEGGRAKAADPIRVIVVTNKTKNIDELTSRFVGGRCQGMITNSVRELDREASDLLKQSYPGTDFSQVMILQDGRVPSSANSALAMFVVGVVLAAVGGLLGVLALIYRPR
ncbi:MAG: hypothetical protein U0736_06000 [Gemmataceae bacterium]